jgi:hypothetical protein
MQLPYHNTQLKHWNPGATMPLVLPVHLICNTSDEEIHENIKVNSRRPGKWIALQDAHEGMAVLCGSGPSLADSLSDIRDQVKAGATLFAMNGAASFLASHGLLPDYQCIIDAREQTADLVGPAKRHLFASQVHPKCFEREPDAIVWHLQIGGIEDLFPEYAGPYALIGGAASVGNTATCLAYTLGFREIHCYGYDSSHKGVDSHAFRQPMNDGEPCAYVDFRDKTYLCSLTMKLQAEKFMETSKALKDAGCKVFVHGHGLLPDIYNAPPLSEEEKYASVWAHAEYRDYAPGEFAADKFIEIAQPHTKVIDFGCGTGRGALKISKACEVLCIDFAANCRDKEAEGLPFLKHDLREPIPVTAPFGFCTDVMEHIPPEDVGRVLANIARSVKSVFFQISTRPDHFGQELIGHDLHLTVQPHSWWREKLSSLGRIVWEAESEGLASFLLEH